MSNGNYLLVANWGGDSVPRYNGTTGAFVDVFVSRRAGRLNYPYGILFGPHDQNLYVSTGEWGGPGQLKAVLRFDGATGAFIDNFAVGGNLESPRGIIFGPDGHLYVADRNVPTPEGRIARFDGFTGAYLGDFVASGAGGLWQPSGLVFGPSPDNPAQLDLYIASGARRSVLRYDGTTGEFRGAFVTRGSGGLGHALGLTFGPDGNLYVASGTFGDTNAEAVFRYQGPSSGAPAAFLDIFVPPGSGGLRLPFGLVFGPDGNDDGHFDLYVANSDATGSSLRGKKANVKRYDGVTGAFIDTFVPARSGGINEAAFLTFTSTDPVTLEYNGTQ
ncbi:MAG: SMP-30/gluconolactonase/LRE family protein [Bryobacteraceae bacterium]